MPLGSAIRQVRGPLSQTRLAERLDLDQTTVSRWEVGRAEPSLDEIARVEAAVGAEPGTVLRLAGYVTDCTVKAAIDADPALDSAGRRFLLATYQAALESLVDQPAGKA